MRTAITAGKSLCVLLGLMTCLPACSARDSHIFRSTVDRPVTVSLRDPFTKQMLWTKPIPVNHILVLDLQHPGDVPLMQAGDLPATHFTWEVYDTRKYYGTFPLEFGVSSEEDGEMDLPGSPVQIYVELRPAPEYPADYIPPTPAGVKTPVAPGNQGNPGAPMVPAATPGLTPAPAPGTSPETTPAPAGGAGVPPAIVPTPGVTPGSGSGSVPATNPANAGVNPGVNPGATSRVTELTVAADGSVSVSGRKLDDQQLGDLLAALAKEDPTRTVKITPDKNLPLDTLTSLVARIHTAGLANVNVAAQP